jgi:hypothetical protein
MKNILFLIVTIVLFSCENKTETIKGELYFKLVRLWSSDGSSESAIETYLKKIEKSNNDSDKKAYAYFSSLKKHNLLSAPKIMIKLESGEVKEVFLNQEQYQKVKNYKLMDLNSRGKKVILLMEVEKLENDILFSYNIENIKVVNGKNSWSK